MAGPRLSIPVGDRLLSCPAAEADRGDTHVTPMVHLMRFSRKHRLVYIGLGLLAVLALGSAGVGLKNALATSKDFEWSPSRLLLFGQNPYALFSAFVAGRIPENPFLLAQIPTYPAHALVWLWPFAALPWRFAAPAWALVNIILSVGIVHLVQKLYFREKASLPTFLLLLFLLLSSTPYRVTLGNGQHGLVCIFFLLAAIYASNNHRPHLAALFLAASWIKYSLTLPISLLFLRRDRIYVAIVAAVIDLTLTVVAAAWTNSSIADMLYQPLAVWHVGMAAGYLDFFDTLAFLGNGRSFVAFLLSAFVALGATWIILKRSIQDELLSASLLSLATCIATVHLLYDCIVFLFPLAYVIRNWGERAHSHLFQAFAATLSTAVVLIWFVQRLVEACCQLHPGAGSSLAVLICWICASSSTYVAFGLCVVAHLDHAGGVQPGLSTSSFRAG